MKEWWIGKPHWGADRAYIHDSRFVMTVMMVLMIMVICDDAYDDL